MYITIKRIYKNSYDEYTGEYNVSILDKAVKKKWITEKQKEQIIKEVG
jgi:hypothetical protein